MYKLIIGNVRVTVSDDKISRNEATAAARQAMAAANQQGKLLSHIEITLTDSGLDVQTTEKTGSKLARKSIKQSMLDSMHSAIKEKLFPTGTFSNKEVWYDPDTGQEWRGSEVDTARDNLLEKFEEWMKSV
ncbi:hypothetical protein SDC9_190338 [bioreactor metagenome]|jgi:hypothetical protein|uniref:Uncharacterized protein n=1 Tax=bioreactor metagenome TaxID=1076179 RepID=A0A645HVA5_9ZZZZ